MRNIALIALLAWSAHSMANTTTSSAQTPVANQTQPSQAQPNQAQPNQAQQVQAKPDSANLATQAQTTQQTNPATQADTGEMVAVPAPTGHAGSNPDHKGTPSIEEIAAPNNSELSKANAELLVKNAELERRVDELTTQVNVLTHERSGQLFLYGVMTVIVTIVLCILAGAIITMRGQRSRW